MVRHLLLAFTWFAIIAILAARIARETEGVQDVVNRLEVRG